MLSQLRTFRGSSTGELDEGLLRLLSECYIQMSCCRWIQVIEVMNHIEQVFVNLNLVKGLKKMKMVEVIHKGRTTSRMINKVMPILQELNQRVTTWSLVPPLLHIWIYN